MKWIAIFMSVLCLSGINPASADDDHRFPMDLHDLGLTKQQHRSVEEAMKEYQYSYRRFHHKSEKIQEEINALFLNSPFDADAFRSKSLERERGSIEIQTRLFERIHAILTPEQKRRFVRHLEEWDSE
jgi:Spy/CpxP family protein refolding chaperone